MLDSAEICRRISEIRPELGVCGVDIKVSNDGSFKAWRVDYEVEGRRAQTFLDDADVELCLSGKECLSLGMMVHQQMV